MFNVFCQKKYIPDKRYMLYLLDSTEKFTKKYTSQTYDREKYRTFDLTSLNTKSPNINYLTQYKDPYNNSQPTFLLFLSISSLMYYFINKKG